MEANQLKEGETTTSYFLKSGQLVGYCFSGRFLADRKLGAKKSDVVFVQ